MPPRVKVPKDFAAGLLFLSVGIGAAYIAQDYRLGVARQMGPGYFPTYVALILAALGALMLVRSLLDRAHSSPKVALKPVIIIAGGTALFALLIEPAGLLISCATLVILSSLASAYSRLVPTLISTLVLAAFSAAVFSYGLGLPLPLLGYWFRQ
jgi:putative tricarboxylic transport membrane protein